MVWKKRKTCYTILFVLMLLAVPVLAKQEPVDGEDQYILKDEWKNKHMVQEDYGELTQVVFMLTDIGDPDGDGHKDGYELLDYRWSPSSLPVQYVINPKTPTKNYGLSESAVVQAVENSFESWDAQSTLEMFDTPSMNNGAKANLKKPDGKNVVTWGRLSDDSVIAFTTIWYYTQSKQIIDADMVYNTYYSWGIDIDGEGTDFTLPASTFDIQDIGTHEAGHVCSLADISNPLYDTMTMYGYGSPGEVYKISLEPGDIAGLQDAYP